MLREPAVDEGVIRVEEFQHAAIFLHDGLEEQLRLALHRGAQRFIEVRERLLVRRDQFHVAQLEPLPGEVVHERMRPRILEHTPHLRLEIRAKRAARGLGEERVVRQAAPKKVREARRERVIIDRMHGLGVVRLRLQLAAEEEVR